MKSDGLGRRLSPLYILMAGSMWGTMGLFVNRFHEAGVSSMSIVTLRGLITAVCLGIVFLIFDRDVFKIKLKDVWIFVGSGVFSIVFFNYCYFRSIVETSMSVAAVLLYTAPAFVMIMSALLFKEGINAKKILAVVLTIVGCALVTGVFEGGARISPTGLLIGLGAGFGYALYSIFGRFAILRGYSSFTITFYTFLFSVAGCIPLCDFQEIKQGVLTGPGMVGFTVFYVVLTTILPYMLYTKGLENVENGKASIIASVEPIVATLLGFFVMSQTLSAAGIIGIVLVITGIVITNV